MKNISPALLAHYTQQVTTLTTCWKLSRRDGVILGFTAHHTSLTIDGIIYESASGFTPTAIAASSALDVDNLDVAGMLSSDALTEADILAGLYDYAEILIFEVNYADPEAGILVLRSGWLGEIETRGTEFKAEIRGLTQKLSQTIGSVYSPTCRAQLGDARCMVDMSLRHVTGSVTGFGSQSLIYDTARTESSALYTHGVLTMTSGENTGIIMEVKAYTRGQIVLTLPLPYPLAIGDTYSLSQGCDKQFSTCRDRFANSINFRGEPHVPGLDKILETASTRSG